MTFSFTMLVGPFSDLILGMFLAGEAIKYRWLWLAGFQFCNSMFGPSTR